MSVIAGAAAVPLAPNVLLAADAVTRLLGVSASAGRKA